MENTTNGPPNKDPSKLFENRRKVSLCPRCRTLTSVWARDREWCWVCELNDMNAANKGKRREEH